MESLINQKNQKGQKGSDSIDLVVSPRQPHFVLVDHPEHVIIRGNNQEPIFYADEDYRFYPKKLQTACEKHTCAVHVYALMTNHVHLLIHRTAFLKPCR